MRDVQCDRNSLIKSVDNHLAILDYSVLTAEMLQSSHNTNTSRINQVAIVVGNVDVRADAPAADTLEDTEGLGVQGVGMANDTVEDVGDICFKVSLSETETVS